MLSDFVYALLYERIEKKLACADEIELKKESVFQYGCEHIGIKDGNLDSLLEFSSENKNSDSSFFTYKEPKNYSFDGQKLTFTSPIISDSIRNNTAVAHYYPAKKSQSTVLFLGHWNSSRADYCYLMKILNILNINCLHLSLPYHDERQTVEIGYAAELVSANVGLTLQANRQAVCDALSCISWLKGKGHTNIGIIGSSIGSSIATLTATMSGNVKSLICIHMAGDFAQVVLTGSATKHIKKTILEKIDPDTLINLWAPISPSTYLQKTASRFGKILVIYGKHDGVFLTDLTLNYISQLKSFGCDVKSDSFGCGHYTIGKFPFNIRAVYAVKRWLQSC